MATNPKQMTEQEKELREKQIAQLLNDLLSEENGYAKVKAALEKVTKQYEDWKGLDPAKILSEVDKIKSVQESFTKMIRNSKRGFYVSGIEGEKDFSILRAMVSIRTGNWKGAEKEKEIMDAVREKAAQAIGDDKLGGYFVPDQVIPDVIGAIYTRSVMINLSGEGTTRVSLLEGLTGGNVKIPKFDGGLIAYWIGEEDAYAESQVAVGDVTMNPKKMGILVRITDSMKKLGSYGFENLLRTDMQRAAAKKLDWTILKGLGTDNMPRGVLNTKGVPFYVAKTKATGKIGDDLSALESGDWQGDYLGYDGIDNMMLALEEDDVTMGPDSALISSPRFFRHLKQVKAEQFSGQVTGGGPNIPYLLGIPMIPDNRLADIIGPFDKTTQLASNIKPGADIGAPSATGAAKHTTVLAGNLSTIVLGRWAGIEIEDDAGKGLGFTKDHTYMKLRMYADVCIRQTRELIVCPDARVRA